MPHSRADGETYGFAMRMLTMKLRGGIGGSTPPPPPQYDLGSHTMRHASKLFLATVILSVSGLMYVGLQPDELVAQGSTPVDRYEFPQDGVVCYRTTRGPEGVALSCLKK